MNIMSSELYYLVTCMRMESMNEVNKPKGLNPVQWYLATVIYEIILAAMCIMELRNASKETKEEWASRLEAAKAIFDKRKTSQEELDLEGGVPIVDALPDEEIIEIANSLVPPEYQKQFNAYLKRLLRKDIRSDAIRALICGPVS